VDKWRQIFEKGQTSAKPSVRFGYFYQNHWVRRGKPNVNGNGNVNRNENVNDNGNVNVNWRGAAASHHHAPHWQSRCYRQREVCEQLSITDVVKNSGGGQPPIIK